MSKRLIITITVFVFLCFFLLISVIQAQEATPEPTLIPLPTLQAPPKGVIAQVIDTSGNAMSFHTLTIAILETTGDMGYLGGADSLYSGLNLPIRQGEVVNFVNLSQVSEYQVIDGQAIVVLTNGQQITGVPVEEAAFSGTSAFGDVSVTGDKIQSIKFNPDLLTDTSDPYGFSWDNYTAAGSVLLDSGTTLPLKHMAVVYIQTGCDQNWIPCKYYSEWSFMTGIPVKIGEFATNIDLTTLQDAMITPLIDPNGPTPSAYNPADTSLQLTSQDGEKANASINNTSDATVVALIGETTTGFAHVPINSIKEIQFSAPSSG